ncbi:cobalt-precorrin-6A reductase [Phormidium sp. CCY1219]|uniref:cobalt-precorrin-6A reductase n=1 Tax=Phormidium sp. CCY1219 TaxID=2886104 RepID=UPI002D1EFCBF|nr:cobalt-precorrin-6A reductase [Phormidium sp. CCY1219]MEB3829692.1 cobalt-precorrin-6A reductase [Phormidium sp. CCY1219]
MRKPKRVLILSGTGEGLKLAARASKLEGLQPIASLAGRTRQSVNCSIPTRIGGFGGVSGLREYLREQQIDLLIDATHPFAAQMSWNAAIAAGQENIPHVMLLRPAWEQTVGDRWVEVQNHEAAAGVLPGLAPRLFLTIGRQELASYAHLSHLWFLMRIVTPPPGDMRLPPGIVLAQRGPFSLAEERSLLRRYDIGAIVTKNSGGDATYPKIMAAREFGLPVVMIQRPSLPQTERIGDIDSALCWLRGYL